MLITCRTKVSVKGKHPAQACFAVLNETTVKLLALPELQSRAEILLFGGPEIGVGENLAFLVPRENFLLGI